MSLFPVYFSLSDIVLLAGILRAKLLLLQPQLLLLQSLLQIAAKRNTADAGSRLVRLYVTPQLRIHRYKSARTFYLDNVTQTKESCYLYNHNN